MKNHKEDIELKVAEYEQKIAQGRVAIDPRLLDSISDAVLVTDEQFALTAWNKTAESIYGWTAGEVIGRNVNEIIRSEVTGEQRDQILRILAETGRYRTDVMHHRKDGEPVYLEATVVALRSADGHIYGYLSINRDINERRQAEEALKESEDRYRDLVEHSRDLICTHDLDGLILSVNQVAVNAVGYDPEDFVNKRSIRDILAPEMRDQFDDYMIRIRRDGYATGLMVVQTRTGEKRVWEYHNTLRTEGVSKPVVRGMAHDVTESKRTEKALREREEWFKGIFEGSRDAIFLVDATSRFVEVNQAACDLTGYSRQELLLMRIPDLHEEPDLKAFQEYFDSIMNGQALTSEAMILRKDGGKVPTEFSNRMITFRGMTVMHTTARDVSDRKRLEERLQRLERMEAIGRLAGGVAHDFNNLLTAILGYSELLLARLKPDDPSRRDIEEIEKAGRRAASLTSQLLAFSRKQVIQPRVFNLNTVVMDMRNMLQRLVGDSIELITDLDPVIGSVRADPGQIEQVLTNLAVNARDAMADGGVLIIETARVSPDSIAVEERRAMRKGSYVMLAVTDTGKGMDQETQSHIFEPFFTTKEMGKGTGLGLSTAYGIVQQSDGYIWVDSDIDRGTTFRIYLPQVGESAEEKIQPDSLAQSFAGSETILLVEDEEVVRKLALHILRLNGYTVLEAADAAEALSVEAEYKDAIHLLITDMVMPKMGGLELSQRLLALRPVMKVIYMSGYTDNAVIQNRTLEAGASFIQKPFSPTALLQTVRSMLSQSL